MLNRWLALESKTYHLGFSNSRKVWIARISIFIEYIEFNRTDLKD